MCDSRRPLNGADSAPPARLLVVVDASLIADLLNGHESECSIYEMAPDCSCGYHRTCTEAERVLAEAGI